MNTKETLDKLLTIAKEASTRAYSPYSGFKVGSALITSDGSIYSGSNVENASYSLTICAERTAIFKAVTDNKRDIVAIAIYVDSDAAFPPCGACRQVMAEFNPQIPIVYANNTDIVYTDLRTLLPGAFCLEK